MLIFRFLALSPLSHLSQLSPRYNYIVGQMGQMGQTGLARLFIAVDQLWVDVKVPPVPALEHTHVDRLFHLAESG